MLSLLLKRKQRYLLEKHKSSCLKKTLAWGIVLLNLALSTPIKSTENSATPGNQITRIPMKNKNFIGRSKELNAIETHLKPSYSIFAVTGFSGVGKTQLVKRYVHQSKSQYNMTWWFDASSPLLPQFIQLAHTWNKNTSKPEDIIPQAAIEGPEIIQVVKVKLEQHDSSWLLVFDNARDIDLIIKDYIPQKNDDDSKHHVLITSKQNAEWKDFLKLTPLSRSESIQLLGGRIDNKKLENSNLNDLAELLGDIPLTLVQAASHIQKVPSLTVTKYIELFTSNRDILSRLEQQVTEDSHILEYEKSFSSTMWLTLQELQEISPVAYEFLLFLSFIAHKDITESLITDWLKINGYEPELLHEITYNLTSRFLIEKTFEDQDPSYEIHQLLQDTIHRLIPDEKRKEILQKAKQLFLTYVAQDTWLVSDVLSQFPALYAHLRKIYNQTENTSTEDAPFMIHLAHAALFYKGDRDFAEALLNKVRSLFKAGNIKALDFNHARFLNTKAKLYFAKNLDESISETKESIRILKTLKGDTRVDSELFLATVNNLSDYYQIQGRVHEAKQACELFKDTISKFDQKIYGTLYYSFLALSEMYAGEYKNALKSINLSHQHLQDGKLSEYLFIFVLVNKAEILARMGEFEQAEKLVEKLKQDLEDLFQKKSNHLVIRVEIIDAFISYSKGDLAFSEKKIKKAIENYNNLVDSVAKDPLQGFAHTVLGDLYYASKNFKMALEEYKTAEHIYETVLKAKEIDDLSDLYQKITTAAADSHHIELTREYLKKQVSFFGLNHKKTQSIVKYLDEKEIPIPW